MKFDRLYTLRWLPLLLLGLTACHAKDKKKIDSRVTLWRLDKIPYGTYVAYNSLPAIFPDAKISVNKSSPLEMGTTEEGGKAYVIIAPFVEPEGSEVTAILNYAGRGNQVFISAISFGDTLLRALKIKNGYNEDFRLDSLQVSVYNPVHYYDSLSFTYPGYSFDHFASSIDTPYTSVLGRDSKGHPDFIRMSYKGGGALFLHFAPLAFSNFFLLHKNNKAYFEHVFSYLPASVQEVVWDDYFRYNSAEGRRGHFSAFGFIFRNRSLYWGFWLLLLLFAMIYLFESKRRQRMVPVISGLRNHSLDFVRTIGRLYYQRKDNHNLAVKMATHFQDHVRTRYNMPVQVADPGFTARLSFRTGIPVENLQELVDEINLLPMQTSLTDEELLAFHRRIEEFYKQA